VPITGATPKQCFDVFRGHLARLLADTVPTKCPVLVESNGPTAQLGFRRGNAPVAVPVETKHGRLFFWVAQLVRAEKGDGGYRLSTLKYWYKLQASSDPKAQALIRWEYDRGLRGGNRPCRHHVQQQTEIRIPDTSAALDLDKLHLPTGWVKLEEVLRFLIYDLGMKPPCGKRWPTVLEQSERVFREQFSTPH
jgi:hypothetical protein